jgi:hypothetical protein
MTKAFHYFHLLVCLESSRRIVSGSKYLVMTKSPYLPLTYFISLFLFITCSTSTLVLKTRELKWVLSATSISMVFSFVLVLIQFFEIGKKNIVGTCIEGGTSVFLLAIWAGGLPVIMNPVNNLAVYDYKIVNANLYL